LVVKVPSDSARAKRQIKLAPLKARESFSELRQKIASPESSRRRPLKDLSGNGKESAKLALPKLNAFASRPSLKPPVVVDEEQEEEAEIEESVWCGSDADSSISEDELPSPRKLWPGKRMNVPAPKTASSSLDEALQGLQGLSIKDAKKDAPRQSTVPKKHASPPEKCPVSSHDTDSLDAILRFSPPRLTTRPRQRTPERPITPPPASPSKSKLVSPSKAKTRIPTPPIRQSLDAFWSPNEVNEWNDKHSPRKAIGSPKKNPFLPSSESTSTTSSPKKSSPTKRSQAEVQAKKDFAARKHAIAEAFLIELDQTITSGQIAALSASTGGVRLVWSKTLNSTAGRANWRRETVKIRSSPTEPATTKQKHHASIELAEKVIDDEERLFNVLAHEFCHLANFMVSGIKDQPHGASFKAWGSKCTAAFASRGVQVTTKHSYQIDYKYVWRCSTEGCWAEFKRHSKSIDPQRHTCGSCRGKLLQIKPVPRGSAVPGGKVGGYAGFVKQHFADVKKSLPAGSTQKDVMEAVGRKYREEKEKKAAEATTPKSGVDDLARALDVVVLDD
jgi:predicted SprT family Zn-dependent metalloprotease